MAQNLDLSAERNSLRLYLKKTLVETPEGMEEKRSLQSLVMELFYSSKGSFEELKQVYGDFRSNLYRTGRLQWAYELEEAMKVAPKTQNDPDLLQRVLGNQALILQAWGKLEEAMELHQKEEALCLEESQVRENWFQEEERSCGRKAHQSQIP